MSAPLVRLAAALLMAPCLTGPGSAAVVATAHYAVTLGGTHVATVAVNLSDGGGHYAITAAARITGLAQFVASGMAQFDSSGRSSARGLESEKFDLVSRASGGDLSVDITYANSAVTSFLVTPPVVNTIDRVPIERSQLGNVNDMIAPFIIKGGALDRSVCERKMHVFTGLERFDLTLRYAKDDEATSRRTGYQGPVVVCHLGYTPISGHYTTSEITSYLANNDHMLIWYAPLATPGYFIPYRILVTTTAGDLSMVLTELEQDTASTAASD